MGSTHFKRIDRLSSWRRLALHLWRRPKDPTVYGNLDIDMSEAVRYLEVVNREFHDTPVTVTHLVVKAIAKALATWPQSNSIVSRGRLYMRDSVDVYCQVATDAGNDLSGVKIPNADRKSTVEIAAELNARVQRVHARKDAGSERTKRTLAVIPEILLTPMLRVIEFLTYDLRLDLSRFGIAYDQFGGAMVSNVGVFGIGHGLAPLVPASRTPIVLLVGEIKEQAVVSKGKIVIAPRMQIGSTFDHRVIDGFQAGSLARIVIGSLEDPFKEMPLPNRSSSADGHGSPMTGDTNDNGPSGRRYKDPPTESAAEQDRTTREAGG